MSDGTSSTKRVYEHADAIARQLARDPAEASPDRIAYALDMAYREGRSRAFDLLGATVGALRAQARNTRAQAARRDLEMQADLLHRALTETRLLLAGTDPSVNPEDRARCLASISTIEAGEPLPAREETA